MQNLFNMLLPSSKLGKDIEIEYNQCGTLQPISIAELSLTQPMKKKLLSIRQKNNKVNIQRANEKLSLIIPYRNREEHLKQFIPAVEQQLQEQDIDYEIIIAEQDDNHFFNKAKLMNIATLHTNEQSKYYIFHDVDSMPTNINYTYCNQTVRPYNYIKRERDFEEYPQTIFGGVIIIPKDIFYDINGFSNNYWQWGKEDDDFLLRHLFKGYIPFFDTQGRLTMLPHPRALLADNSGKPTTDKKVLKQNKQLSDRNKKIFSQFKRGLINQENDGINSVKDFEISSISTEDRIKTIKIKFDKVF